MKDGIDDEVSFVLITWWLALKISLINLFLIFCSFNF